MKIPLAFFILIFAVQINAATYTFSATGYWTDQSKWDIYPGTIINSGDVVDVRGTCTIPSGVVVTNNGRLSSNFELIIGSGGTMNNNGELNINFLDLFNLGTLNNNNTLNINNGARLRNGGVLNNNNTLNNNSGAAFINNNGGTLNNFATLNNRAALTNNSGATLNNNSSLTNLSGGTVNTSGALNNNSGATLNNDSGATLNSVRDIFNNKSGATLNNSGVLKIEAPDLSRGSASLINSGALNSSGSLIIFLGQLNNSGGGTLTNSGEMTIDDMSYASNSGTLVNTGTGTISNAWVLENLAGGTLTNNGLLNNRDFFSNSGTLDNNGTLVNFASFLQSARLINLNNGKLNNNGGLTNYGKLINKARLKNNGTLFTGDLGWLILSEGVLDNTAGNITMGDGSIIERAAGTISAAPVFEGRIDLHYTGSAVITTGAELPASPTVLSFLVINNAAGVNLGAAATVNTRLVLQNGVLRTGENILTLSAAALALRGGSCLPGSCFVAGNSTGGGMRKLFNAGANANFIFPVGSVGGADNGYTPVGLSNVSAGDAGDALTVRSVDAASPALLSSRKISRYWQLTESGNIATNLRFTYLDADDDSIINPTRLTVFRNTTNMCASDCVTENAFTATATGVTEFSPWTIAETSGQTAAQVTISGRVVSTTGRGVSKARIQMIGQNGEVRYALTNPFGYYRFVETAVGETYTFSVSAKNYTFAPRVLNLTGEVDELNFTARP